MTRLYELYQCEYKGEIVYIGQGLKGRHKHCNSGCSHVYDLNKIHFSEGKDTLKVSVLKTFTSKREVEDLEKELIKCYNPKYNSVYTRSNLEKIDLMSTSKQVKKDLKSYRDSWQVGRLKDDFIRDYEDLCSRFFLFYGSEDILSNNIKLYSRDSFKEFGEHRLALFSRYLRSPKCDYMNDNNYYSLLCRALLDLYNVDLKDCLHKRSYKNVL